jgi:4-amino-4-deoxy-L-arabinose transferase-like glycosyltransferase
MTLFQTSFPVLSIYTMVRAEPLFMFFLLLTLLGMVFYTQKRQHWILIVCGITAAGALMTRYVGVIVLPPLVLTALMQEGPLRRRFKDALLVVGAALLPSSDCSFATSLSPAHPRNARLLSI